ncbi:hypothetical protein [Kitasatospora sp. NPDC088779]|uniref:hypothetical protein n=1 Tax=Kitasatospora sp. NPDC088779 TaxID=3154964 RepID=UPI00343B5E82
MTHHTVPSPAPAAGDDRRPNGARLLDTALAAVEHSERAARRSLCLIPAENTLVPAARLPYLADLAARYMFDDHPDPAEATWRFPAAREAQWLETGLAVPLLQQLLGAAHVNVRPLSGLQAMQLTIAALPPGATVAVLAPEQGGHYATAGIAQRLGHPVVTLTGPDPHHLDPATVAEACRARRPALLYVDQCHTLLPYDLAALCAAVKDASPATLVHADISHLLGLVMGGAVQNPLAAGADSLSASTHKSFAGPQKGILATNSADLAQAWRSVQPQIVSNHHFGSVAALGIALAAFADRADTYARTVIETARALGKELAALGWDVAGAEFGHTRTHQLWVTTDPRLPARRAAERLYAAGIRVNWLTDLPLPGPALRLGLAEAVWRGLGPGNMAHAAQLIDQALTRARPADRIAADVAELCAGERFPFAARPDSAATARLSGLLLGTEAGR